ncbi:hypothetical protein [Massilia sp. Root335]|jgi:hypothetical protein|uniref:hypothetical protein n=1 Tax=Massilia sp. Root335 TaxID=1736517 RepID=UPI0006F344D0|nr:hypothetical protein [Massilia sp. Root335]KQV30539.1 hypothetical protein ASC93_03565 [Massilia sp. Root335]
MRTNVPKPDPGANAPANLHEADIGSGERSPAQHETDAMIREIPPRGHKQGDQQDAGQQATRDGEPGKR